MGIKAFEEIGNDVVQTVAFTYRKNIDLNYKTTCFKLLSHNREEKRNDYIMRNAKCISYTSGNRLLQIPGQPIAYWVGDAVLKAFRDYKTLGDISEPRQGMATGDNGRFLRLWFEVEENNIAFGVRDKETALRS